MSELAPKKGYEYRHIYYVNKMAVVSDYTFTSTPRANIHYHNGYELILITQGNYTIYAPNKLYEGSGPCLAAFRFGTYHGCVFSDCESVAANRIVINYTQSFIDSIPSHMLNTKELFENDTVIIALDEGSTKRLSFIFSEFYNNYTKHKDQQTISPETYGYMTVILNIVSEILRGSNAILSNMCRDDVNYVYEIMRELLEHSDRNISVADLSERFFVSRTKLSDDFQRVTGVSIKHMIDELRIERIKNLLLLGHSNKEITEQCGFSSDSYFAQFFQRHMKMSPQTYRKLNNIE